MFTFIYPEGELVLDMDDYLWFIRYSWNCITSFAAVDA